MKTKIFTLAILMLISITALKANHNNVLEFFDLEGNTICLTTKDNLEKDAFVFDTKEVFKHLKKTSRNEVIDIKPFVKPEKEVDEDLPFDQK